MNKAVIVVASLAVGLSACGKTIPECGDAKVQELVIKIVTDKYAELMSPHGLEQFVSQTSNFLELTINGKGIEFKKPFFELTSKTGINLKLDGISSTKKDKESGFNYCSAKLTGAIAGEMKFAPVPENAGAWQKLDENPSVDRDLSMTKTTTIFNLENFATQTSQLEGAVSSQLNPQTATVLTKFNYVLPESSYSVNLNDKGDQLLVKVKEDK